MRIGSRITLTTSALVALILGVYGWMTLRERRQEREEDLSREAGELAMTLRAVVEEDPALADAVDAIGRAMQRAQSPWRVEFLPIPPPEADDRDPRVSRMRRATALKTPIVEIAKLDGKDVYIRVDPVRVPAPATDDGFRIIGAIEVQRAYASAHVDAGDELTTVVLSMLVLILILVIVVSVSTRSGIGRPIAKLIAGIDDVAKGDLSHVVLQERDDEIGALAARFNDMTKSLRDAREETRRSVDERLALETHLRSTAQLATIGQLAAEIAHEVGTPLNVVTGRARAMAKRADDPEAVQKNATIIAEQAQRITRIIQRLLDVARRKVGDQARSAVDLNKLAESTMELLEHQLGHARVDARTSVDGDLGLVPGEKDQLQQVLLNLYMNAIQAMPSGGRLAVKTSRIIRRRPGLEVAPEQAYAVLTVSDTGIGIPEKDRGKIFEAFYTSKADAGGTGLGLAVAHGIVKDHDGWIEIDDNPGGGTIFRVYLPLEVEKRETGGATAAS